MGKLVYYSNILNNKNTLNQEWRSEQQEFVNEMFDNTTIARTDLYEEGLPFDFKFVNNPECWIGTVLDVSTGMVKNSDDYRSLYFKNLDHDAPRGRYYKWNDNYWLVYETSTDLETISTCNIRRCNNWLKWITSKGEVLQYPCVIEGTLSSANAQVAKTITQANSHIDIVVQGNKDTLDIYKNLRIVINGCVYRFYSINNYMQNDYVDKDTPLLFMDFFLDMKIDEDNLEENLANDNRADFILECNVNQVTNKKGESGVIVPTVYYHNNVVDNPRMEFISSDESVVTIDEHGNYKLLKDGEATVTVQIYGNTVSAVEIPFTVEEETALTYHISVTPIIEYLKQGLSKEVKAEVVDNLNVVHDTAITLVGSGVEESHYQITELDVNTWRIKNVLYDKQKLVLTFRSDEFNIEYEMPITLKAMI